MYKYRKYVFVLIIILFAGAALTAFAQDLEFRVTDTPIPGVPLQKGGVAKIASDSTNLPAAINNAGMMKPAESDATATQQPGANIMIQKGDSQKAVISIEPQSMPAGSTQAVNAENSSVNSAEAGQGKTAKDVTNSSQETEETSKQIETKRESETGAIPADKVESKVKEDFVPGSESEDKSDETESSKGMITIKVPLAESQLAAGDFLIGSGTQNYSIPDLGYRWVQLSTTESLPADAAVTNLQYRLRIDDTGDPNTFYCQDYEVWLSSEAHGAPNKYTCVYDNLGGRTDGGYDDDAEDDSDIYLNWRSTSAFNGEDPSQNWCVWVEDKISGDTGVLSYIEFHVYWETSSSGNPNLIANYTPSGWDYPVVPSSVSGTNTVGPNLEEGTTTYIDFAFVNRDADIPSSTRFYIYLYSDGNSLAGWYWDGIGQDYYGYVEDYEYTFTGGNHTLKTSVDATDVVSESNEGDNEYSRSFYWTPSAADPNLIANYTPSGWDYPIVPSSVTGTNTVGPNLEEGATTYIDFAFINRNADIPSSTRFYIYLYLDGSYLAGWYWDGIDENYYGYVEDFEHTFSGGNHTLGTNVDATNTVSESNEDDNEYSRSFFWTPTGTDPNLIANYTPSGWDYPIVPSSLSGTNTVGPNLVAGSTTYIDFAFINRNADVPPSTRFYIYLYCDGNSLAGWYWDGIEQDYYGYVEDYEYTFTGGNHTLKTSVDATDVVSESNEGDNEYSRSFYWTPAGYDPNLIADYTPSGWDYPIVPSSMSGTNTVGPNLQGGSTTYIDFAFINRDADISTSTRFYIYLYGDGSSLAGWYWDGIPQDYYGYVEDYEYTFSDGNHVLKTEVDATDVVAESNEDDNEYQHTFTWGAVTSGPNLIAEYTPSGWDYPIVPSSVSGTNTVGPGLAGGSTTYIDFAYVNRNQDIPTSTRFYTYLYVDDSPLAGFYWDGMPADYYGYVEDYEYEFTDGQHVLKTFADATDVVAESDETDNEYERQFTWGIGEPEIDVQPLALEINEGADSPFPENDNSHQLDGEHPMGHIIPGNVKSYWKTNTPQLHDKTDALLASIDWSSNDSPVKNQGNCGSCWAFSAVGLTENLSGTSDLSEQTLVSCIPDNDCGGGWHGDALHYIHNDGAPNESCYPYIAANGNCADKCTNPSMLVKVNQYDHYGRWGEADASTVNNLKALLQSGPVLVHMEVPADNSFNGNPGYSGGIYNYTGGPIPSGRGHSVLAVGYNDDQQYFKVKNSWGSGWGENGYFRISYNDVTDYVRFGGYACTASGTNIEGNENEFTIFNIGSGELEVTAITSSKGWLTFNPSMPPIIYIAANTSEAIQCNVNWSAVPGQTDQAVVTIYSNDSDEPTVTVDVTVHKDYTPPPVPGAPTLASPPNNSTNRPTSLTLSWNASSGASSYELQVDDDQDFSSPVVSRSGISSTSQVVSGLTESTMYYWRVNASNSSGTSPWSSVWRFTTIAGVPAVPTLASPPNNATNQPTTLSLSWNAATGATSYQLQVDDNNNFGSPVFDQSGITATSQSVSGLASSTMYYWRVNAANTAGVSPWSTIWHFTTISSSETVVATIGCGDIVEGGQISIPINIDMSGVNSPNDKLGSYTGTLQWNPALINFISVNGGTTSGWGNPTVNTSQTGSGLLDFASANPSGTPGDINILNVTFGVPGSEGQSGTIDLDFSAMTAAGSFLNLIPMLTIEDCNYTIMPSGLLGDVNGDDNVNSTDALIVLSCDVGIDVSQFCPMNCGDVNNDGLVNSTDALIILSYDVGIRVPFPVNEPGCPTNVTPCPGCNP